MRRVGIGVSPDCVGYQMISLCPNSSVFCIAALADLRSIDALLVEGVGLHVMALLRLQTKTR